MHLMKNSMLADIETVAGSGKAVMSADDCTIVAIVQEAISSGRSASFYLSSEQYMTVRAWYWTPERIRKTGTRMVSSEEKAKIKSELGIEDIGPFHCNRITCECGEVYGAFEFLEQGIREHGKDAVRAVFALKDAAILRTNPRVVAVCPNCEQLLGARLTYDNCTYGCSFGTEE
ncbi:hypothetical protein ABZ424_28380 [Streptomyces sp. NPDC005790]|uniref:hypothetical protein n=1 Tax=Streptomyces sp. NPDC005790 TaxID=3154777 RepID=UPI0033E90E18